MLAGLLLPWLLVPQVLLQYLPDADSLSLEMAGAGRVSLVTAPPAPAKAKMDLLFNIGGDGLMRVEYMEELYDASMVRRLAGAYLALLAAAAATPYTPAADVDLATPEDAQLLASFVPGDMHPEYLSAPLAVHMIEDVAAAHPDRVALEYEGKPMTYGEVMGTGADLLASTWGEGEQMASGQTSALWPPRQGLLRLLQVLHLPEQLAPCPLPACPSVQLNALANRLAHQLVDRGICHNVVVGIMLERSFELIIAILATLKVRMNPSSSLKVRSAPCGFSPRPLYFNRLAGLSLCPGVQGKLRAKP
jgi:non-ribosomal peptide synthetase component F